MAKEPRTGRAIFAAGVPKQDVSPKTWSPPSLAPAKAASRLPISLASGEKGREEKARPEAAYEGEPGMVLVPSGEFIMGDDEGSRDEKPQRKVLLNSFWIDTYPVTNVDYKRFVDATGHRRPPHWTNGTYQLDQTNHPVTNVSWQDAVDYAAWAGKRLPTEAEWEKASRGTVGQTYPWGDNFRKDCVNSSNDYEGVTPVDQFAQGASPFGVMDMCGNVMEWCLDYYADNYYASAPRDNPPGPARGEYRVLRGGYYGENKAGSRCAARHWAPEGNMQDHIGFRCAADVVPVGQAKKPDPAAASQEKTAPKPVPGPKPLTEDLSLTEMADRQPEAVGKVVRGLLLGSPGGDGEWEGERKAGVVLATLPPNAAAGVMKFLTESELEVVARGIAARGAIEAEERRGVHDEVRHLVLAGDHASPGGPEVARDILKLALGPRKAQGVLDRVLGHDSTSFQFLRELAVEQLVPWLTKEHPQTMALILTQLGPDQAAAILAALDEPMRNDIVHRITRMDSLGTRVLLELEEQLSRELQALLAERAQVGGPKVAAEILDRMGGQAAESALDHLAESAPELADDVRTSTRAQAETGEGE